MYICDGQILVYDSNGFPKERIKVPERPSTIAFGGENRNILYIAARTSVYKITV
ncbi:SMP-30/gluconolactonase/LRE family protein [Ruminiclostridium cellobioparum]|uniref:SMP-30/gluconolactonase/LRE family protein n=1 Tax=Ruminiclostridium cellobioparum TaxID=29355 RepID=UPI000A05D901